MVLFHGNAAVEGSFSFNFLVANFTEQSLISQRCVHDFIINSNSGDVKKNEITKGMIAQALKGKRENESDEKEK